MARPKQTPAKKPARVAAPARPSASDAASDPADDLKRLATEVNSLAKSAHDAVVDMAMKLAEAKRICRATNTTFKSWIEQNVKNLSYDYCRRLASKGAADDPVRAIEDMRTATAAKVSKHTAKRKAGLANPAPAKKAKAKPYEAPGRGEYQRALAGMGIETRKAELASLFAAFGVRLTWETDKSALAA